jgi:hypothetical protein
LIERSWGPYRNSSFFIPKKNGKYRFIISCTSSNKITLENAGLPPNVEFAESFASFPITTLIDFYSGYEQVTLDGQPRGLLAFQTSRGLYRPTTMVQGATNSVSAFVRIARKIIDRWIGNIADIFVDIGIRGPRSTYNDEFSADLPGVCCYILEYIQNINRVVSDIEHAGGTISGEKSDWCSKKLEIVEYI